MQGFLVMLAIFLGAVWLITVNGDRTSMAATGEWIKLRLLLLLFLFS